MEDSARATPVWPDDKLDKLDNTADIAQLLEMLPDDSKAFG